MRGVTLSVLLVVVGLNTAYSQDAVTPNIPGVVAAGTQVELIKDGFDGTEGPIALPDGSLIFTETRANRITKIALDGATSTFLENSNGSNGLGFTQSGDLISAQTVKPAIGIIHPSEHAKVLAEQFSGTSLGRPNDLVVDKHDGIYFTDPGVAAKPNEPPATKPAVYFLSPSGQLKVIATDIGRPNGIQLSPDEKTLYVANTFGEYVFAYDITSQGTVGARRNFAKLDGYRQTETGYSSGADGLVVDGKGRLYVASNVGVQVFDARGQALGVIPLPKQPQNLAFAGKDKKTLYIVGRGAAYKVATLTPGYKGRAK